MSSCSRSAVACALGAALVLSACSVALDFDATSAKGTQDDQSFCSEHLTPPTIFCDDFDGTALASKWPAVEQHNGSAKNDGGAARSSPNSLLSVAAPVDAGEGVRAVGSVSFPALAAAKVGIRVSFALRVEQFDPSSGAKSVVFDFLYGPLDDYNEIALNLVSTESAVSLQVDENAQTEGDETAQYAQHGPLMTKPARGEWMTVDIDIDINQPRGQENALRVSLNGKKELDTQLMLPFKGGTPRLELGVGWVDSSEPTQRWVVRYDDFLVEAVALR